jgi:hypothetical protein
VTLIVAKQSGTNTVAVADEIKARWKRSSRRCPQRPHAGHRRLVHLHQGGGHPSRTPDRRRHPRRHRRLRLPLELPLDLIAALAIPTSIIATFA